MKKALTALNSHLLTRTYLVGERITLADISVAMTLLHLYQYVLEPNLRKPYQNVNRWFQTVIYQPESIAVIGAFKLAEKTLEYDPKKYAETQGKVYKLSSKYLIFSFLNVYVCIYIYIILVFIEKRKERKGIQERIKGIKRSKE